MNNIKNTTIDCLPPAGVNVPIPPKPVVVDDAGAANVEPKPVAGFCPNIPPEKRINHPLICQYIIHTILIDVNAENSFRN